MSNGGSRSREGAWIEISTRCWMALRSFSRSREGAWIEMNSKQWFQSRQRRRSREGAWIEILTAVAGATQGAVAPVRERGLKCRCGQAAL